MKRMCVLLPVLVALQVGVSPALAWTWPVDGPVLQGYEFGDDPYAGGKHRGIDVGGSPGGPVVAPAGGTVSFVGSVPGGGTAVTIETADGYSVTLVHLGGTAVQRGMAVGEGELVGFVGPSGEPEVAEPYVHLGIRVTAEEHGYLDPLAFLPPRGNDSPPADVSPAAGAVEPVGGGSELATSLEAESAPALPDVPLETASPESAPTGDGLGVPAVPSPAESAPGAGLSSSGGSDAGGLQSASGAVGTEGAPSAPVDSAAEPASPPAVSTAREGKPADPPIAVSARPGEPAGSELTAEAVTPATRRAGRAAGAAPGSQTEPAANPASVQAPELSSARNAAPIAANGNQERAAQRPAGANRELGRNRAESQPQDQPARPALGIHENTPETGEVDAGWFAAGAPAGASARVPGTSPGAPDLGPEDSRPREISLAHWIPLALWIPLACLLGAVLGAGLVLARRWEGPAKPGSPTSLTAPHDPYARGAWDDELPEADRLSLERELELILGASADHGARLACGAADRVEGRSGDGSAP